MLFFNLSLVPGKCFAKFSLAEITSLGCRTEMFLAAVVTRVISVLLHMGDSQMEALLCLKTEFVFLPQAALLEGRGCCRIY